MGGGWGPTHSLSNMTRGRGRSREERKVHMDYIKQLQKMILYLLSQFLVYFFHADYIKQLYNATTLSFEFITSSELSIFGE